MSSDRKHVPSTNALAPGRSIGNLQIIREIGRGASGVVHSCRDLTTGKMYAVKSMKHKREEDLPQHRRKEIELHRLVSQHKHIIGCERVIETVEYTHVVLEHAPEGDLFTAITDRDLYSGNHPFIRHVFLQLIDAVEHCHNKGVYHRDLKPENVLVFDGGRTVKLADFGLATTEMRSHEYGCGSHFYYSPECQNDDGKNRGYLTAPNDIWALGVILINLSCGRNPWSFANKTDDVFLRFLQNPDFLLSILPITKQLNEILKKIFCVQPFLRMTLQKLRKDIKECKYFTRTAESDRWEKQCLVEEYHVKMLNVSDEQGIPSPPPTPRDDRCQSPVTPGDDDPVLISILPPGKNATDTKGLRGDATVIVAQNDSVPESLLNNLQALSV